MATPKRLIISDPAETDLLDIWTYIASNSTPTIADTVLRRLDIGIKRIGEFPFAARLDHRFGVRLLVITPYLIAYLVTDESIEIVRVVDGRRDLQALFGA